VKKIIVDASGDMVRSALLDGDKPLEILIDPIGSHSVSGNIYTGIVKTILPNQFVFIDIGLEKNAFLNFSERREVRAAPKLKPGQTVLVQVVKDPGGAKGARVTAELSVSGRYAVLMKKSVTPGINVSKKVTVKAERKRLKAMFKPYVARGFSAIVRTEAASAKEKDIAEELKHLAELMETVERDGKHRRAPAIIYGEVPAAVKQIREIFNGEVGKIIINSRSEADNLLSLPGVTKDKIEIYKNETAIFEKYGINAVIEKTLESKVWLKSGSFLVIDRTESCFVIDVNTGKYTGKTSHGKSMLKTDLEAAEEIAYQIRLRNMSGMIIIDFIDIKNKNDKALVRECLQAALSKDRIPVNILDSSVMGLFILTRKRMREPITSIIGKPCPHCGAIR